MKVFVCLLAMFGIANATFLSFLGGGGGGGGGTKTTYNVIATPASVSGGSAHGYAGGHGHGHGHGGSTQLIKVILEDGHGHSYNHGYANSHAHGSYGGQVYKVIEQAAPAAPVAYHANSGSSGYSYGQSYASGHGYGHGSPYSSQQQFNAILPQIIQLVLQEDSLYGGGGGGYGNVDAINGQLIDTFGQRGKAIIMRADKAQGAFFKSGHVVQRGTLKVMRVQEQQQQQQQQQQQHVSGGWSSAGASSSSGGWSSPQPAGW